jgi:hypothetical protein
VAILVELVFPAAITMEVIDAVTDEMDVDTHLPAGGILQARVSTPRFATCGSYATAKSPASSSTPTRANGRTRLTHVS